MKQQLSEPRLIGLASYGHALCHVAETAFAGLLLSVKDAFALESNQAVAALSVPMLILFGVIAVPAGMWADRFGARRAMTVYFALVAATSLLVAHAQTPRQMMVGLGCLGAAISIYHPAGLAMLAHGCTHRGRAMGIHGIAGSLGLALGPAIGLYCSSYLSWRTTYWVVSILAALGMVATRWVAFPAIEPRTKAATSAETVRSWRPILVLSILFLAMTVGGFNYRSVITALPTFLSGQAARGGETAAAEPNGMPGSVVVFLVLAVGGVGQIAGGYLADRFRSAWSYPAVIVSTIPCALALAHFAGGMEALAAGAMMMIMFAQQPLENTIIADATPAPYRSTVYGLKFILAFGVASVGAPVAGAVWDNFGIARVFDMYAICAFVMAGIAAWYAALAVRPAAHAN